MVFASKENAAEALICFQHVLKFWRIKTLCSYKIYILIKNKSVIMFLGKSNYLLKTHWE